MSAAARMAEAVGSGSMAAGMLPAGASRMLLAGQPRAATASEAPGTPPAAHHPKEVLMALAAASAAGVPVERANPHFLPIADWADGLAVAHFGAVELVCPVPVAHNTLLLDGQDLLTLAEERRVEDDLGLHRQRCVLMDRVLSVAPAPLTEAAAASGLLPAGRLAPLPIEALLEAAPVGPRPRLATEPVRWLAADLETGPYNFLHLKREPKLGTSQLRVLMDPAARGGRPAVVAAATPRNLGELVPALRAFAALAQEQDRAGAPLMFVLFFGTPEELAHALSERPHAGFFGDNFRCPAIRLVFAPFAPAEVLEAVRGATVVVDTCFGGLPDALARGFGVGNRILMGADGRFDAWVGGRPAMAEVAWDEVLSPAMLARRRHKADRSRERLLAEVLESMLGGGAARA